MLKALFTGNAAVRRSCRVSLMRCHVRSGGLAKNSSGVSTPALRCIPVDLGPKRDVYDVLLEGNAFFCRLCRVSLVRRQFIRPQVSTPPQLMRSHPTRETVLTNLRDASGTRSTLPLFLRRRGRSGLCRERKRRSGSNQGVLGGPRRIQDSLGRSPASSIRARVEVSWPLLRGRLRVDPEPHDSSRPSFRCLHVRPSPVWRLKPAKF